MSEAVATPMPPDVARRQRDMRILVLAGVVGLALGWWAATSPSSPIKPKPERPVLKFLIRVAKFGLWAMMFVEPPPPESQQFVHARVDEDGNKVLHHGEGW